MKRIKKLMALMLAAIMALAMSITAFATSTSEQKTITINNPTEGHTYTAYQILTGTLADDGQLTGLDWGNGISEAGKKALRDHLEVATDASAAVVAKALSGKTTDSEEMDAVAQILGDGKSGNGTPLTATNDGKVSASVAQGYYVIVDTLNELPDGETTETSMSKYMVQVVGDVAINTKASTTSSQKTLKDAEDARAKFAEANIGEEKTFYLVGTLPADYAAYSAFYMMFNDTMNRMDYVALTSVEVRRELEADEKGVLDPTTGTKVATLSAQSEDEKINGYRLTAPTAPAEGTVTDTLRNTLSVEFIDLKQICPDAIAGDSVVITYQAKLNSTAMVNVANVNEFDLKFSNDPNNTTVPTTPNTTPNIPTGVTPKDQADLYTTEIELTKKDGTTGDILTGAEFTLTGDTNNVRIETKEMFKEASNGTYWKLTNGGYTTNEPTDETAEYYVDTKTKYILTVQTNVLSEEGTTKIKAFVGTDGKLKFSGLGAGKYELEETKVPNGYNKMTNIKFEISFNKDDKSFTGTDVFENGLAADIKNLSGSVLPSTGGIGTTIFYIVGAVLVIGAGVILVTKKRMSKEV